MSIINAEQAIIKAENATVRNENASLNIQIETEKAESIQDLECQKQEYELQVDKLQDAIISSKQRINR